MKKILLLLLLMGQFSDAGNQPAKHLAMHLYRESCKEQDQENKKAEKNTREVVVIEGRTVLHKACDEGNLALALELLDQGDDPQARDVNNDTPLILAIRRRDIAMIALFASEQKRTVNPWYINVEEIEEAYILALYEAAQSLGYDIGTIDQLKERYKSEAQAFLQDRRSYIQRANLCGEVTKQQAQEIDQKVYGDAIFSLCLSLLPELVQRDREIVKVYAETWGDSIWLATKYFPLGVCIYIGSIAVLGALGGLVKVVS